MLKKLIVALLYTALSVTAIPAVGEDLTEIAALREGTMKKLIFHSTPKPASEVGFETVKGDAISFSDYKGQIVIVNFWATWCAPCRKEMPALNDLGIAFENDGLVVLPIATGRNPPAAIRKFFEEAEIDHLETKLDPKGALARDLGVFGLPATIILSPSGEEIARMTGDAEWFSQSAQSLTRSLLQVYADELEAPGASE